LLADALQADPLSVNGYPAAGVIGDPRLPFRNRDA